MAKVPLLKRLQELHPEEKKEALYARILCGEVIVGGAVERNPKVLVAPATPVVFARKKYVGRGGMKLESVLPSLMAGDPDFDPRGKTVLDAGSSTGGFVDALLAFGADRVVAVDVGTNQLAWSLRVDPRVVVCEQTSILDWQPGNDDQVPDFCTADLSFRSLAGAAARLCSISKCGKALVLIKPQFERAYAGLEQNGEFSGVVPDDELPPILDDLRRRLSSESVEIVCQIESGLRGTSGNREFFAVVRRSGLY